MFLNQLKVVLVICFLFGSEIGDCQIPLLGSVVGGNLNNKIYSVNSQISAAMIAVCKLNTCPCPQYEFPGLGCFSYDATWCGNGRPGNLCPQTPAQINTLFTLFNANNKNGRQIVATDASSVTSSLFDKNKPTK